MIRRICFTMVLVLAAWVVFRTKAAQQSTAGQGEKKSTRSACPVTPPDKFAPTSEASGPSELWISRRKPALRVGLWPDGTVVFQQGGPGSIEPDGSLGMKFPWWRENGLRGKLKIHGRRLDASAPPLRAYVPEGYGNTGFQVTGLIFPTEGCWEVTGEVGDTHVTFVTRVVRIKESK
jgi:hypothetical protein